jgi:hypothetical protein
MCRSKFDAKRNFLCCLCCFSLVIWGSQTDSEDAIFITTPSFGVVLLGLSRH